MQRRAKLPSPCLRFPRRNPSPRQAAFLLIEAGLAAVAIAVGLVAITRGLGSSLATLASLQRRDAFLSVAESTLQQLRAEAQQNPSLLSNHHHGTCESVSSDCEWELTSVSFNPPELDAPANALQLVTLTVRRSQGPSSSVSVRMVWPGNWLTE